MTMENSKHMDDGRNEEMESAAGEITLLPDEKLKKVNGGQSIIDYIKDLIIDEGIDQLDEVGGGRRPFLK